MKLVLNSMKCPSQRRTRSLELVDQLQDQDSVVERCVEHVAKDVEPHRLRFVDEPAFDASQFLDEENKQKFLRPLDFARDPDQDAVLPRVKIRANRENKLKLLETLDRVAM